MPPASQTLTFAELADNHSSRVLALDDYQRGFVWGVRRVRQLVSDLVEYQSQGHRAHAYYMGTVILHRPEPSNGEGDPTIHYVIDGQQRLAALALLWAALARDESHVRLPSGIDFQYRSPKARARLQHAYLELLRQVRTEAGDRGGAGSVGERQLTPEVFSEIAITTVTTRSEDEAFAFFDSQNTRGVLLETTDLLKAHHLRAIRVHSSADEAGVAKDLQRDCARRWERLQHLAGSGVSGQGGSDFGSRLFSRYLWRGRRWSGISREQDHRHALLGEFRDEAYSPRELTNRLAGEPPEASSVEARPSARGAVDQVPCFPSGPKVVQPTIRWSRRAADWEVDVRLPHQSADAARLPMSLRQPLSEGAGFFLYAERYGTLLRELERPSESDGRATDEWGAFRDFYRRVLYRSLTIYLRQPFLLASLLYVDRFEDCRLLEFALWLEHVIGAERMYNRAVHQASVRRVLGGWDGRPNLLDVIAHAAIPDTIIRTLRNLPGIDGPYRDFDADCENFKRGADPRGLGTQKAYACAVREYYEQSEAQPLANKREWIGGRLRTGKVSEGMGEQKV